MIKLFQISLTREDCRRVNAGESLPKYTAHLNASCFGEFPGREFYAHVADLAVNELEHGFQVGNIGPEESITRHAPMHSVSVGDVLVLEDERAFIVKACGFEPVANWN